MLDSLIYIDILRLLFLSSPDPICSVGASWERLLLMFNRDGELSF